MGVGVTGHMYIGLPLNIRKKARLVYIKKIEIEL